MSYPLLMSAPGSWYAADSDPDLALTLPLVDGDRLAGFAWPECLRDDGKVRALTVLLDEIDTVEDDNRSLAGPAPTMQQMGMAEPVELSSCS